MAEEVPEKYIKNGIKEGGQYLDGAGWCSTHWQAKNFEASAILLLAQSQRNDRGPGDRTRNRKA